MTLAAICCLVLAGWEAPQVPTLRIQNRLFEVAYRSDIEEFSLRRIGASQTFVSHGRLSGTGGAARVVEVQVESLGKGQAIEVAYPGGNRDEIVLVPELPFVLLRMAIHNGGTEAAVIPKVRTADLRLDLGRPVEALKVLGTGGLKSPQEAPGSYLWMAVADAQTRKGVVAGWISAERGSGIVLPGVQEGQVRLETQLDYGRLRLKAGQTERLETLAIGWFDDARLGLEAYADTIARRLAIKLLPQPCGYCTWYHAHASTEKEIARQSKFVAEQLAPFGFSVMQIDDGWQEGDGRDNGPNKNFTRHRADGPYASGMKATADEIRKAGLVPGLWFMPFGGTYNDPWFADKQAWFVKRADNGKPYDTDWGGTCLDMTLPEAREYLRTVVDRITHTWGYRYLKMDGLYTGTATPQIYVNDAYRPDGIGDAVFHDPDKTNVQACRDGLKVVRQAAGPEVFLLGCCIPQNMRSYGAGMGLVDAMRIGPDNGASAPGLLIGPDFGSRHYFLHGRVWYNDPDPIYVRSSFSVEQARLSCSWVGVTGQLTVGSDDFKSLPADRLEILKRVMPAHGATARPVDLFDQPLPRIWLVTDNRGKERRDVVGLFNWTDTAQSIDCSLERMGLADGKYGVFDFWANASLPAIEKRLQATLGPMSCKVLAVRRVADHPQLVSTSRHVSQGMVDVVEENWDPAAKTLAGTSRVVGRDAYELRVSMPEGAWWRLSGVEVSAEDRAAGVSVSSKAEAGLVRVSIGSPQSRGVRWKVAFASS